MKKIYTILAMACVVATANAQKAKISQAENALILGKIDQAQELIDAAIQNEKSSVMPMTYVIAAKVASKKAVNGDSIAFAKVGEYMAKAEELDATGDAKGKGIGKAKKDITKAYQVIYEDYANAGAKFWELKNFNFAYQSFMNAANAHSKFAEGYTEAMDSVLILNAGIAAMQTSSWDRCVTCFTKTFEMDYDGSLSIQRVVYAYQHMNDTINTEKALKAGFEKYPQEKNILLQLIQHYLNANKNNEALVYLNEAIERDGNNAQYYFARGCLNEKIEMENAIADYNKALSIDANHYSSLYNLAIVYFYKGQDFRAKASDTKDDKEYNEYMKQAAEALQVSKPYIEKAVNAATTTELKIDPLKTMEKI